MSGAKITKEQIFPKFDNPDFTNDQETLQFLNYLEKNDQELYEIGCSFEKAHKFAHFSYTNGKPNYMCPFFNEWLNEKKKNYTSNGENCNKVQLWTEYIEKLWIQLVENEDNKNWCPRETD
ncbi:PIR Superfamily Protein, partial [Plasmodium ovale curtisi]